MTDMRDFDSLIDQLASESVPVRVRSVRNGRLALAALSLATLLAVLVAYGFRSDVLNGEFPPMRSITSGLMLLLACAAGGSAVRMSRPQVGAPASGASWALAALLIIPLVALAGIIVHPGEAAGLAAGPGLRCLGFGLGAGTAALAFLTFWLRRGAPVAPERAAWLAGLAAGAVGALAVTLECPADSLAHIGVWHVAVPLVAGAAARLVLPRFLRW